MDLQPRPSNPDERNQTGTRPEDSGLLESEWERSQTEKALEKVRPIWEFVQRLETQNGFVEALLNVLNTVRMETKDPQDESNAVLELQQAWSFDTVDIYSEVQELIDQFDEISTEVHDLNEQVEDLQAQRDDLAKEVEDLQERKDDLGMKVEELEEYVATQGSLTDHSAGSRAPVFQKECVRKEKASNLLGEVNTLLGMSREQAASYVNSGNLENFCYELQEFAKIPGCTDDAMEVMFELAEFFDWNFYKKLRTIHTVRRQHRIIDKVDVEVELESVSRSLDSAMLSGAKIKWNNSKGEWDTASEGERMQNAIRGNRLYDSSSFFSISYDFLVAAREHSQAWSNARLLCANRLPNELMTLIAEFQISHPKHRVSWEALPTLFEFPPSVRGIVDLTKLVRGNRRFCGPMVDRNTSQYIAALQFAASKTALTIIFPRVNRQ
ncbi:MAG: hypothetical protein M1820_001690 [Bogoriella megaspora]|nr:MAG: hypothetical protein M1820_001690 [Bogoriella megaspora]